MRLWVAKYKILCYNIKKDKNMGAKQQILYYLMENFNILWKIFTFLEIFGTRQIKKIPLNGIAPRAGLIILFSWPKE